jgi:hypothetical protein
MLLTIFRMRGTPHAVFCCQNSLIAQNRPKTTSPDDHFTLVFSYPGMLQLPKRDILSNSPAISKEVRELIQDMWRANPTWSSPRIRGELRKLGITCAHPPDCGSGARHMRDPALLLRGSAGSDKCAMIIYGVRPSQHQGTPRRDTKAKETVR